MYKKRITGWARHWDFILMDYACLCAAFFITFFVDHRMDVLPWNGAFAEVFVVALLVNYCLIILLETMEGVIKRGYWRELAATVKHSAVLTVCIVLFVFTMNTPMEHLRTAVSMTFGIYTVLTYLVRVCWRKVILLSSRNKGEQALLVVATEDTAVSYVTELKRNNVGRHNLVGVAVSNPAALGPTIEGVPVIAMDDKLVSYITQHWVDEVFISDPMRDQLPEELVEQLTDMGVTVHINLDVLAAHLGAKQVIGNVGGHWVLSSTMNMMSPWQAAVKRCMDIAGGLAGCILTGIIYLIIAPKIRKESPGPIFFSQTRIGRNGKPFKFYKFRSMYLDAEERKAELMAQNRLNDNFMFKLDFDPRIIGNRIDENGNQVTGIGEFIRKTSLDEFPQFLNVLRGEMSLVGTRPPLVDEYEAYHAHHKARLSAKPGITGVWQVSGRSNILDFDEVVRMDTWYINNWSVGLDLKILLKTIRVAIKQEGSM